MREIKKNGVVLARHITPADFGKGLQFFSQDSDFVQVGLWSNYEAEQKTNPHIHYEFNRIASRTQEALYVISGSFAMDIYDLEKRLVETVSVGQGEILVLLDCGHGCTITSDNTTVLEVKNGPYAGAEKDRHRF